MADFPTALTDALERFYSVREDYRSPVGSRRGLTARMGALERAYGSKAAAARAAGVDPGTWSRWGRHKQTPGPSSLAKVAAAHLALLRAAKVARKGYPSQINVQATVAAHPKNNLGRREPRRSTYYNGGSSGAAAAYRWFNADRVTAQQLRDVVNAWAAGQSPRDVADALQREVERSYPGRFDFEGTNVNVQIRE